MIVLDTHALIWWVSDDRRLSKPAATAIESEQGNRGEILVSAITAWEIAVLIEKDRLKLAMDLDEWLSAVEASAAVSVVPVSSSMAVQSARLPGDFHADPADRMIVALARETNAPLVTADKRIQNYKHVKSIW